VRLSLTIGLTLLLACHSHEELGGTKQGTEPERPGLSFTSWTNQTELFVELPALVRDLDSPFAAHVTRLSDFSPIDRGSVTIVLTSAAGEQRFSTDKPSVPGIFRPVAKPKQSGKARLAVEVSAEGANARHELGEVEVFESTEAARKAMPEEADAPGRITFLKEQQWPIRLATAKAAERPLSSSFRAFGTLIPRPDAQGVLSAPAAGRVLAPAAFPHVGQHVELGQVVLSIAPRLEAADQATLEQSLRNSEAELGLATREQARVQAMREQGVVSERRIAESNHAVQEAQNGVEAAQRRLAQYRGAQGAGNIKVAAVPVRSPLGGTIAEVLVEPGSVVDAGDALVHIIDPTRLWLEAYVAEEDARRLSEVRGAWADIEGAKARVELDQEHLVARAPAIDAHSHALSAYFEVANRNGAFTSGALADVHLLYGPPQQLLSVPEEALIDDNGLWVVFVEVDGEAFERRIVEVVVRDRGLAGVRGNLADGEHVATHGSYAVKLAASSGAVPAHGHSH
jgi:cobalt-zinc-cadmium efflux system membrane fusion protein